MRLQDVIEELVEERGIDKSELASIVCEGMLAAYAKKYPDLSLKIEVDKQTGELLPLVEKEVVSSVEDDDMQVSVKKARYIDSKLVLGDKVWVPFDGTIGRIEILRARQVIASGIKKIEAEVVYQEFKSREGEIVMGIVHKCERNGTVVKLGDVQAFLPRSLSIPGDKCVVGFSIRALLKEVLTEPRNDNQLVLDRSSEQFVTKLFELEIPEVFEKLVEVKKIVRAPGYKTKMIVVSNDPNIDPVGTCVGVGGSRIKPILKELGSEKIDVIPLSDSQEVLVKNALKPAQISSVEIVGSVAHVWLDDEQRSLAIGRMGQNIALASRLAGVDIQLVQAEGDSSKESDLDEGAAALDDVDEYGE